MYVTWIVWRSPMNGDFLPSFSLMNMQAKRTNECQGRTYARVADYDCAARALVILSSNAKFTHLLPRLMSEQKSRSALSLEELPLFLTLAASRGTVFFMLHCVSLRKKKSKECVGPADRDLVQLLVKSQ